MVALKRIISNVLNSNKNHIHSRYKIELISQDGVVNTLGIPGDRSRKRVMEVVRYEVRTVPTVTHAVVRSLDGTEHTVYASDGKLVTTLKALAL